MIPLKLRLQNFLSYRDGSELDLTGVHVACLCGDNGHGKSALLDAMTWALWGCARGRRYGQGGNSADELVYQGESDMEVSLDFLADGMTYRVLRKHSKGGRSRHSHSLLDLQAHTGTSFRSVSEATMLATERRLEKLLRMSYETFVNSAFLLQGQADKFTTSQPAKRKETLAEILGLSLYVQLEEKCRYRTREVDGKAEHLAMELGRVEEDLVRLHDHREARATNQLTFDALTPEVEDAKSKLEEGSRRLKELEEQRHQAVRLEVNIKRADEDLFHLEKQVGLSSQRVQGFRKILSHRLEIEQGIRDYNDSQISIDRFTDMQSRYNELVREQLELQSQIVQARTALEMAITFIEERIARDLSPKLGCLADLQGTLATTLDGLDEVETREQMLQGDRDSVLAISTEIDRAKLENERLLDEMRLLRQRLDLMGRHEATCPLCGTTLGPDGFEHLAKEIEIEGGILRDQYEGNLRKQGTLGIRLKDMKEALTEKEGNQSKTRQDLLALRGRLEREVIEGNKANEEFSSATTQISRLKEELAHEEFGQELKQQLVKLEKGLYSMDYDPGKFQETRLLARALERFVGEEKRLQEAESGLPDEEASLNSINTMLQARRTDKSDAVASFKAIEMELLDFPVVEEEVKLLEQTYQKLEADWRFIQGQIDFHLLREKELEDAGERKNSLGKEAARIQAEKEIYVLLSEAFGKRGIQALLIEAAIPELEATANGLLGRLTSDRLHLTLQTQRLNRRGDATETLEILIADELGTRSYELFSGGEAFRISFALRVALAKLLASRAGAPMRALFLDEGFGTQDATGRERLIDAVHSIQEDFDLMIVITHIDELKEAFPVRIEVAKREESGSAFNLVWN